MSKWKAKTLGGSTPHDDARLAQVIEDVLRRRSAGETLPDDSVAACYPELMPKLLQRLQAAGAIRRATLAARRAGPLGGTVEVLSDEALEAPIECGDDDGGDDFSTPPAIEGYRLIVAVGAGGQANVYKAVQESTGRTVAVKVLFGGPFLTSRHRSRFATEVMAMAIVQHANVVRVLDRGCTRDGSFFLAMDFIDGQPIDRFIAERRPTLREFLSLFHKISCGLAEAHRQNVVHRDLKPTNVRVDVRGEPYVTDFGLARVDGAADALGERSAHTLSGQILGSIPWASPEVAAGRSAKADGRSDIYSLGVMAHYCLTGAWPYDVSGPINEVFANILSRPASSILALREHWRVSDPQQGCLGVDLAGIISKALAKDPADRQQSADELAAELGAALDGRSPQRRAARIPRRNFLSASAAVIGGTIVGIGGWASRPRPPRLLLTPSFSNTVDMRFVLLPAGRFMMGSPSDEAGRQGDERRHAVELAKPFLIAQTEVTRAQYAAVMDGPPPGLADGSSDLPVDRVTWEEASEFCRRLSKAEGRVYRLPTEAEWEYACRAGSTEAFSAEKDHVAWHAGNSAGKLHPVRGKWPNSFDLFDMHGGVAEWCEDWYERGYGGATAISGSSGPPSGSMRVVRGGSAFDPTDRCRSAARAPANPHQRLPGVGFRVVAETVLPIR